MGEASPFEQFMLVSSYRVIAAASTPTGTVSWAIAIVLRGSSKELVLDGELDLSLKLQNELWPQLNIILTLTCPKLLCLLTVALKSLLCGRSIAMSKLDKFPP